MRMVQDISGREFGRWKALYRVDDKIYANGRSRPRWMCECQCNKHTKRIVDYYSLIHNDTKSCGCLSAELSSKRNSRQNTYKLCDEYYIGYTQFGDEFYFDKEDIDLVKQHCWDVDKSTGYAKTIDKTTKKKLYLHRLIMGCHNGDGKIVDHINRDRADNRKSNLRIVNDMQSAINKGIKSNNTSGAVGVSFYKHCNKWGSYITVNKQRKHLGLFNNIEDAIRARTEAEEKYFGEYAPKLDEL